MPRFLCRLFLLGAFLATASTAQAQTVWRCGDGGKTYSDSPCTGGRSVQVADNRSLAQTQAALSDLQRTQALADRLRNQRLEDERLQRQSHIRYGNLGPERSVATEKKTDHATKQKARKNPRKNSGKEKGQPSKLKHH